MINKDLEKKLKALANKRRLAIIEGLQSQASQSVNEISRDIKLSFKSTSKHLIILYRAGLVEREQHKLVVFYSLPLKPKPLLKTILTLL